MSIDIENLKSFIGKNRKEIEKHFGFDYYLETKDFFSRNKKLRHNNIVDSFLELGRGRKLTVIRIEDGVITDIFELGLEEINKNLYFLGEDKGIFSDNPDDEPALSHAFLTEDYFGEFMNGIIFFSGKQPQVMEFAKILDKHSINYHKPYNIVEEPFSIKYRKLGRNELCHCGSEIKYKKCCLEKDIKLTGEVKRVNI